MGAAGMLCASMEVVERGRKKSGMDLGCHVYIDQVPTKYPMTTSDILLSETQERMMIVSTEENSHNIAKILNKWDLEYSVVGKTTLDGSYSVFRNDVLEYSIQYEGRPAPVVVWQEKPELPQSSEKIKIHDPEMWSVYDNTIGGRTIKGPLEEGSYSILDIYEINKKLFITWGGDFYECFNKMKKFQVNPLCVVNCLNFGHPRESMGSFAELVQKLSDDCEENNVPIVGGNVSLYNSTNGYSIKSTVVLVMVGLM